MFKRFAIAAAFIAATSTASFAGGKGGTELALASYGGLGVVASKGIPLNIKFLSANGIGTYGEVELGAGFGNDIVFGAEISGGLIVGIAQGADVISPGQIFARLKRSQVMPCPPGQMRDLGKTSRHLGRAVSLLNCGRFARQGRGQSPKSTIQTRRILSSLLHPPLDLGLRSALHPVSNGLGKVPIGRCNGGSGHRLRQERLGITDEHSD